jgi:hypothetical protein
MKTSKLPFHLHVAALGAGVMFLQIPLANAAVITWGSATDVVSTLDVSTNGTVVEAFNLGYRSTGLSTQTVNGVLFTALVAPTPLTSTNTNAYSQLNSNTSGDADYDGLLNSVAFGGGANLVSMTLGGGNLIDGGQYELQLWYVEEQAVSSRVMIYGDGNGNTVGVGGSAGLLGQYAIGTFTAVGTSQTLTMDPDGFGNSHLTAYQIRAVPEPSSAALLGLGGLALILRRRR